MRPSCRRLLATAVTPSASQTGPTPYSWVSNATAGPSTGRLAGRTLAIKDNISYTEAPTSSSSQTLQEYHPPFNATCVTSLLDAGAHIVGQTKMDEFGMGSLTSHLPPFYSPVHNPSDPGPEEPPRSAGGSSGGSAAAVAEGSCWAALGTDTGGSVRLPASYCGVVGLKPSYGMISRHGVVAYADSLDCVGVLGGTVDSVKEVFDILSHPDERDMTCASSLLRRRASEILDSHFTSLPPIETSGTTSLRGLRIGLPLQTHLPRPNLQLPASLLEHLKQLGATLHAVDLPSMRMALPAYYVLASAEASSNLGRFGGGWFGSAAERGTRAAGTETETGDERRRRIRTDGFGREVKKRILAGTHALSADAFNNTYLKALYLRRLLRRDFADTFRIPHPLSPGAAAPNHGVDILLHPTAIRTAPPLDQPKGSGESEYLQDLLTVPASLAGLPAMSVPARKGDDGWPVGVSVVGQWGMEEVLFWAGRAIESWHNDA
ncbi:glutaminyl-tRNA synthase (glutamine-hydrolysing) [Saitozyma sp. JCM 24511]|nr:glutaminyl-tRNA synthase (glutamine-hydrolysing) [Saitozyma sp. JCM 24511]